jgi:hypothetical protein
VCALRLPPSLYPSLYSQAQSFSLSHRLIPLTEAREKKRTNLISNLIIIIAYPALLRLTTQPLREPDMADGSLSRYAPSNITVLLMEKVSEEAVKIFEQEGFTVKQAVR